MLLGDLARRAFGAGSIGETALGVASSAAAPAAPAAGAVSTSSTGTPAPVPEAKPQRGLRNRLKIGIALGGGAARGWSHIGVLRVLSEAGIEPDVIAGSSIGAVVGGCYAAGKLDDVEAFARGLTKRRVLGLLDFHIGASGLIAGHRLKRLLEVDLGALRIEDLPRTFAAIATELGTGHEVWLTKGPLVQAVNASYALPGIIDPVRIGGRLLMDGALINPVPVTTARALGADLVVCVNLNGDLKLRGTTIQSLEPHPEDEEDDELVEAVIGEPRRWGLFGPVRGVADRVRNRPARPRIGPGVASVMIDAFNITQDRISRSRLAGDPPDLMVSPKLGAVGLFEFHRAAEAIDLGAQAARRVLPDLQELLAEAERQLPR
ncbi:patatin-like phospholipase family protein [Salinarimonas chemoclinalis]|uniref:patatin-like phospholipase family protein n=1 Tax=Salinarimonas chemoclinalis TaxID=3241599 RepID=UPI00355688EA